MRLLHIIILFLFVFNLQGQQFNRLYDFDSGDLTGAISLESVNDKLMVFCVGKDTIENAFVSSHVMLLDNTGKVETRKNYFTPDKFIWSGFWSSSKMLENGQVALAVSVETEILSQPSIYIFNESGDTLETHIYDPWEYNVWDAGQIDQTLDNGFILGGYCGDDQNGEYDSHYFLLKTDSEGNEEWRQTYGGPGVEWGRFVLACPDSGYIVGGTSNSWNTNPDNFYAHDRYMVKTDSLGNVEWEKIIATEFNDGGTGLCPGHDDEHFYEFGWYPWDAPEGNTEFSYCQLRVTKWTYEGEEIWTKLYGTIGFGGNITSMKVTSDGGLIATGGVRYTSEAPEVQTNDIRGFLLRIDTDSDSLWMHTYEHPFNEGPLCFSIFYDVTETPDGFAACGVAMSYENEDYFQRAWVIRTDECGQLLEDDCWLGMDDVAIENPNPGLFPNPANTSFTISIPPIYSSHKLNLDVYTMHGQLVLNTNINQTLYHCDIASWNTGLYLIQLLDEKGVLWTSKLIKQ